jgi:hypothetical protein
MKHKYKVGDLIEARQPPCSSTRLSIIIGIAGCNYVRYIIKTGEIRVSAMFYLDDLYMRSCK